MKRQLALGAAVLVLALTGAASSKADPPAGGYGAALGQVGSKTHCAPASGNLGAPLAQVGGGTPPPPTGGYGATLAQVGACAPPPGGYGSALGQVGGGPKGSNPGVCPPGSPKDCQANHNVTGSQGGGAGPGDR